MKKDRPCPVCQAAPAAPIYAPFCSKRCADVDLQRWFAGRYAVPGRSAVGDGSEDED
ncbi:DNA gyrase inhibitor YacG [Caulobacter sp. S45]|jgi:endogenous inhibitor of DNA gyrase (YacG/DUF329 family)|uniref:DNA gyrase inhibitor YacG n=1 Tax=Caulobacter sp. S45 TaxID=1641861 RepID=UPI00131E7BF8|nr:DNA gyrase inhibitor YacG [Caulobacter sp. S45]